MYNWMAWLEELGWLFCPDDCPCDAEVYKPLLKRLHEEDEHWLKGKDSSLTSTEAWDLSQEAKARWDEYHEKRRELEALVRQKKLRYVEAEEQLNALTHEIAARPWKCARGQLIAAAIADFHNQERPALEHKPLLMIEHQKEVDHAAVG